jgi:hypothetical protein
MKIKHISLEIEEHDFELYEQELVRRGWKKEQGMYVFRKNFGAFEVVVEEKLSGFSSSVALKVSAGDDRGIPPKALEELLKELVVADKTEDPE